MLKKLIMFVFIICLSFLAFGCVNSKTDISGVAGNAIVSDELSGGGELPDNNCRGLTAEKVQNFCGSGGLVRDVSLIDGGYKCVYSALDPFGTNGLLGAEVVLSYFDDGQNLADIKEQVKSENQASEITDIENGFYSITPTQLALERQGVDIDIYSAKNSLVTFLSGTEIDYEVMDEDPAKGCSLNELLNIEAFVSGENKTGEIVDQGDVRFAPPGTQVENSDTERCCEIIVADVTGAVEMKDGTRITHDMRLNVGDKLYTVDSLIVIGIVCNDDPNNVKMFVVNADEPTEISIELGSDGKPVVVTDPGVAQTSVKQLPMFETDFQVSTPRLTCSVRG